MHSHRAKSHFVKYVYSQTSNCKKQFRNLQMQIYQASCFKMIQTMKKIQFLGFVSSHKKGTMLTSFHIHSLLVFHTDLQKNKIVTCILTEQIHILSNMQDRFLQIMQLIQYPHVSLFSTVITNEFAGEDFYLSQHSMDGYEAM
jgi:hypothetical protein